MAETDTDGLTPSSPGSPFEPSLTVAVVVPFLSCMVIVATLPLLLTVAVGEYPASPGVPFTIPASMAAPLDNVRMR